MTNEQTEDLIGWYEENKRDLPWRRTDDPYRIWVSEIMLQQTRVEAVKPYYERFLLALPDVPSLARCGDETLNKLWQGLGYYSRVRNMKRAAKECMERYGGTLPRTYAELRALPGIGDYTAAAIAAFAFGEPEPAVDGNVLRVMARFLGIEDPVELSATRKRIRSFLKNAMPESRACAFDQALIELGATVCGPDSAAKCGGCPLVGACAAFRENKTTLLPKRLPKKARRTENRTPLILCWSGKTALVKRPEKGLLSGLWEPLTLRGFKTAEEVKEFLIKEGCAVSSIEALPAARHVFTHVVWEMRGYLVTLETPGPYTFYSKKQREGLAIPSAFKAFSPYM